MKFLRNTHNPDGSSRFEFQPSLKLTYWGSSDQTRIGEMGLALHMLDSNEAISFDELVLRVQKYNETFHEDVSMPADIALGLVRCLEDDLAKVV